MPTESPRLRKENREYLVKIGRFFKSGEDVANLVVSAEKGRVVYLRDVAEVIDGPAEIRDYVLMGFGPAADSKGIKAPADKLLPAVTIAVSKRKGTNAVVVAEEVLKLLDHAKSRFLPSDLKVTVTRNYGETAREKADELLKHRSKGSPCCGHSRACYALNSSVSQRDVWFHP